MGLAIQVGMLADLLVNDEEGAEWFREELEKLNTLLVNAGLATHIDPTEADSCGVGTYGYSGLHHLRRCAVHLHYAGHFPPRWPTEQPINDPYYLRYGSEYDAENGDLQPGTFARPSKRKFDHLFLHSDAEGFYVPQRFSDVLIAGDQSYGWVGSSYTLVEECERIAEALDLPRELLMNGEDLAFGDAIEEQQKKHGMLSSLFKAKRDDARWRSHPIAAMMCAKLHNMASLSIRTGALVVFC